MAEFNHEPAKSLPWYWKFTKTFQKQWYRLTDLFKFQPRSNYLDPGPEPLTLLQRADIIFSKPLLKMKQIAEHLIFCGRHRAPNVGEVDIESYSNRDGAPNSGEVDIEVMTVPGERPNMDVAPKPFSKPWRKHKDKSKKHGSRWVSRYGEQLEKKFENDEPTQPQEILEESTERGKKHMHSSDQRSCACNVPTVDTCSDFVMTDEPPPLPSLPKAVQQRHPIVQIPQRSDIIKTWGGQIRDKYPTREGRGAPPVIEDRTVKPANGDTCSCAPDEPRML
eukprot:gnl/MRDRNA2_/MRDRNA2_74932_c0_seq1.p1 gnl/MRDRNA2_/MRDRNA2_74932_c0~~gnl/MRDRNA2_/MRDRNA2_74932_c0_seq1.p1  ORF type:complete len:278 (+),score=37.06 gnl/MRDRNA2_/MRDRNA2_74932_c0_seq1:90-923(+)